MSLRYLHIDKITKINFIYNFNSVIYTRRWSAILRILEIATKRIVPKLWLGIYQCLTVPFRSLDQSSCTKLAMWSWNYMGITFVSMSLPPSTKKSQKKTIFQIHLHFTNYTLVPQASWYELLWKCYADHAVLKYRGS